MYGHTVYFSGNEKGGKKGVAFIANQHTAKRVLGYNPINDRLISLRLQAKPINITIIQVYAPTSSATDDVMDEFYNQLQDTLDTASKRDAVFVIGDFNAKIGAGHCHEEEKAVIGKFGLGERNKRGDNLVDLMTLLLPTLSSNNIQEDSIPGKVLMGRQETKLTSSWSSGDGSHL